MIPVVFDTNVFISALLAGRTPLAVLETARNEQSLLLITIEIVAEIEATLQRPKFAKYLLKSGTDSSAFVRRYAQLARLVTPSPVTDCPIDDPDDLKFIECAVGGKARYIVSGDHHLLSLGQYHEIQIVTPTQYLAVIAQHTGLEE